MAQKILVNFQNFIVATRDSGYKSTAHALAELVDNSIEASATKIAICINKVFVGDEEQYEILVIDNGIGMNIDELDLALQFGGSTRFNSRKQLGRYGMGLPNSSISQCKRVEVTTWKKKGQYITNYLDIDEIISQNLTRLHRPKVRKTIGFDIKSQSGTIVCWRKCDRLSFKYLKSLSKHIHYELGRIFRYAIWRGVEIKIEGERLIPFDPLCLGYGNNLIGAKSYGKDLSYIVKIPGCVNKTSIVEVKFVEFPVMEWAKMNNEEKRKHQITKYAGVTILRAEREIDYGWFFMGDKRKENYDDWWRCEIKFNPELDEVFGVTHTKQLINQTEFMKNILVPDIEKIAKTLNNRVRQNFTKLKDIEPIVYSKQQLVRNDIYLQPLKVYNDVHNSQIVAKKNKGLDYQIITKQLKHDIFFEVDEKEDCITLILNKNHLFYDKVFKALHERKINTVASFIKIVEMLIFAAARSEFIFTGKERAVINRFRKEWSAHLKTFIS